MHDGRPPGVSILITSYNYGRFISRAIQSALEQGGDEIEVVVVDNASTDDSWSIVEAAASREPRIRAYRNDVNIGMTRNTMRALDLARGERVLFLSADDYLLPGHVARVLAVHSGHPEIDVVFSTYIQVDENDRFMRYLGHPGHLHAAYAGGRNEFAGLLTHDCYTCLPTSLFNRGTLLADGIDLDIFAFDLDLYIRMARNGKRFAFITTPGVCIRVHSASASGHDRYVTTGGQLVEHVHLLKRYIVDENAQLLKGHENGVARLVTAKLNNLKAYPDVAARILPELQSRLDTVIRKLSAIATANASKALPKQPLLDVILTTGGDLAADLTTLEMLERQTYKHWQLILAVDAPVDLSPLLLDRCRSMNVKLLRHETPAPRAVTLNDAIRLTTGDIVLYLEAGIAWDPGHLARVANNFAAQPTIDALVVPLTLAMQRGSLEVEAFPDFAGSAIVSEAAKVGEAVPLSTLSHRRALLDRIGGFEVGLTQLVEFDFVQRLFSSARVGVDADLPVICRRDVNWRHPAFRDPNGYISALRAVYDQRPTQPDVAARRETHFAAVVKELTAIATLSDIGRATAFTWLARGVPLALIATPPSKRPRLLVIDDRVPYDALGRGYPRARALLNDFRDDGIEVIFYPLVISLDEPPLNEGMPGIEILYGRGRELLAVTLQAILGSVDALWVSRPHNMASVRNALGGVPSERAWGLIYDAEAVYVEREATQAALAGAPLTPEIYAKKLEAELVLTDGVDAVGAVSAFERDLIAQRFHGPIEILPFAIAADPTPASHAERNGLLFVGAIEDRSPNEDALLWFVRAVQPLMSPELRAAMPVRHAGVMTSQQLRACADRVTFLGAVPDLRPVYNQARIFVAPTRFAAGLPQKVYEAAANGLPVVASPLLAKQLGWTAGVDLLVAQTPAEWVEAIDRLNADAVLWMSLRDAALQRVRAEVDPEAFATKARRLVRSVLRSPASAGSGASSG